ncbi:hypothetical protein NMY22_g13936 [Coprinellus aureogranulatus]|nr:hypothetical protein NMY22_g13936 [Coprinellus aureogranulatus]
MADNASSIRGVTANIELLLEGIIDQPSDEYQKAEDTLWQKYWSEETGAPGQGCIKRTWDISDHEKSNFSSVRERIQSAFLEFKSLFDIYLSALMKSESEEKPFPSKKHRDDRFLVHQALTALREMQDPLEMIHGLRRELAEMGRENNLETFQYPSYFHSWRLLECDHDRPVEDDDFEWRVPKAIDIASITCACYDLRIKHMSLLDPHMENCSACQEACEGCLREAARVIARLHVYRAKHHQVRRESIKQVGVALKEGVAIDTLTALLKGYDQAWTDLAVGIEECSTQIEGITETKDGNTALRLDSLVEDRFFPMRTFKSEDLFMVAGREPLGYERGKEPPSCLVAAHEVYPGGRKTDEIPRIIRSNQPTGEEPHERMSLRQILDQMSLAASLEFDGDVTDFKRAVAHGLEVLVESDDYLGAFIKNVAADRYDIPGPQGEIDFGAPEFCDMRRTLGNRMIYTYSEGFTTNIVSIARLATASTLGAFKEIQPLLERLFVKVYRGVAYDIEPGMDVLEVAKERFLDIIITNIIYVRTIEFNNVLDRMRLKCIERIIESVLKNPKVMVGTAGLTEAQLQVYILRYVSVLADLHRTTFMPSTSTTQNWRVDPHKDQPTLFQEEEVARILRDLVQTGAFDNITREGNNPVPNYPYDESTVFYRSIFQSEALLRSFRAHLESMEEELPGIAGFIRDQALKVGLRVILPPLLVVPIAILGAVLYTVGALKKIDIQPIQVIDLAGADATYHMRVLFAAKALNIFSTDPQYEAEFMKFLENILSILNEYTTGGPSLAHLTDALHTEIDIRYRPVLHMHHRPGSLLHHYILVGNPGRFAPTVRTTIDPQNPSEAQLSLSWAAIDSGLETLFYRADKTWDTKGTAVSHTADV